MATMRPRSTSQPNLEFTSRAELFEHFRSDLAQFGYELKPENLVLELYAIDKHTGEDSEWLVILKGHEDWAGVYGFIDSDFSEETEDEV